jgi:hypothetical protein
MEDNILESIKKRLGIVSEYDAFDDQILMDINTVFSILHQLGLGPEDGYDIDKTTTWKQVVNKPRLNMIKNYVAMKVKLMFNPPASSFTLNEMVKDISEIEWRIKSEVECYGK